MTDVEENGAFLPPEPINPENDEAFKDFTAFTRECLITASEPKSSCCRTSVITGIRLFAKSRKNQFTEKAQELCERLSRVPKKKKGGDLMELFAPVIGYTVSEDENGIRYPDSSGSVCSDCFSSLLKGCFISAGRISSPYHSLNLELSMPNEKVADIMTEALAAHALEPKRTVRRGEILLYYKKAETVGDVLNYMGAFNAYFKLEDALIYREFMKNTNRLTNCDSSNINKTVNAAARQVEAITALASVGMLDALSSGIRETARLRLEHPEVTLEELIQYHPSPITRAGIHRRLQKAVAFAEQRGYI
jgi:hypothetical protein